MSPLLYVLLAFGAIVLLVVIIYFSRYRKSSHTALYSEGLINENEGKYDLALHNYEDALNEIRKQKINDELSEKITGRIKILRMSIDYEKNFQNR